MPRGCAHLLSYCAQQASGVGSSVRDADHIEKAFDFGGMPARNGITAATMVAAGFTGVDDVFSGERNFFAGLRGRSPIRQSWRTVSASASRSSAPTSRNGRPARRRSRRIDALLHLMETAGVAARDIKAITVHLPTGSDRTVDRTPAPDVNVQHLLAMLLIDGTLTFRSIHDHARMRDPNDPGAAGQDRSRAERRADARAAAPPGDRRGRDE